MKYTTFKANCIILSSELTQFPTVLNFKQASQNEYQQHLNQGREAYLLSQAAWIVHYRWRTTKTIDFILKFYLYLTMRKSDFSSLTLLVPAHGTFYTMLYCNFGNKILLQAISNVHTGHIWPAGHRFPIPDLNFHPLKMK